MELRERDALGFRARFGKDVEVGTRTSTLSPTGPKPVLRETFRRRQYLGPIEGADRARFVAND